MSDRKRVFVVDDEPVLAMTLTVILNSQGYEARGFTDPREALDALEFGCADLLLSDVMMPGLTGIDLAIQAKALCPRCRVLLISGQAATNDLLEPARANGHDFQLLTKPVAPPYLLELIERCMQSAA